MLRIFVAGCLLVIPAVATAQQSSNNTRTLAEAQHAAPDAAESAETLAQSSTPPQRVRSVTVVGQQECPKSTGDEIIVCSRVGQEDQYRIPTQFRELPHPAANNSWVNRAATIDEVGRVSGGLPDTCSVVGSGGQTGCSMQMLKEYSADRREKQREQESIP
jgi:hypothetical protein